MVDPEEAADRFTKNVSSGSSTVSPATDTLNDFDRVPDGKVSVAEAER